MSRGPVGDGERRIGQASAVENFKEGRATSGVLLRTPRQVEQDIPAILGDFPGAQYTLAGQPGEQPRGDAVD
jgi:hypothetical protein